MRRSSFLVSSNATLTFVVCVFFLLSAQSFAGILLTVWVFIVYEIAAVFYEGYCAQPIYIAFGAELFSRSGFFLLQSFHHLHLLEQAAQHQVEAPCWSEEEAVTVCTLVYVAVDCHVVNFD